MSHDSIMPLQICHSQQEAYVFELHSQLEAHVFELRTQKEAYVLNLRRQVMHNCMLEWREKRDMTAWHDHCSTHHTHCKFRALLPVSGIFDLFAMVVQMVQFIDHNLNERLQVLGLAFPLPLSRNGTWQPTCKSDRRK